MRERLAVIDLGTNTFHLLIAEVEANGVFHTIFKERKFIKLAEDGIDTIGEAPFQRGLDALIYFKSVLEKYDIKTVKAIGTAALRSASNGALFVTKAFEQAGIQIELISGDKEANLIHKGVKLAVPRTLENSLIMDIGGGSVEFIFCNQNEIRWARSFPVGVAVLHKNFHHTNPILPFEIKAVEAFLQEHLTPMFTVLEEESPTILLGASGTFDVLENILVEEKETASFSNFPVQAFYPLYHKFLQTSLQERLGMEGVPATRADMIVVALILINTVLAKGQFSKIGVSAYAMKEGILSELSNF